jgi:type III secretion protein J
MSGHRRWAGLLLAGALGCGHDEILHGIDEPQANQVVVALSDAGISAATRRDEGTESSWRIEVPRGDGMAAQRVLAERGLPRKSQPGFAEVFGKGSIVPTPSEERALYLHALSGELARTIEAIEGVVEARVHLALAPQDPARPEPVPPARAAVLVKAGPGWRARLLPLSPGIQSLVAGAVAGLDAAAVSVVFPESSPAVREAGAPQASRRTWMMGGALLLAALALLVPASLLARHRIRIPRALLVRRGGAGPA